MYGNPYALDAIQARASAEPSPPEIVFNGDFHYLDAGAAVFRAVDDRVRACHATQGNIEYALAVADEALGCGCDYPGYVPDTVVADSDAIVARLRTAAALPHRRRRRAPRRHRARRPREPRRLAAGTGGRRTPAAAHPRPHRLYGDPYHRRTGT
jgi:hypothetical protein